MNLLSDLISIQEELESPDIHFNYKYQQISRLGWLVTNNLPEVIEALERMDKMSNQEETINELKIALVKAVIPLEVLNMAGLNGQFDEELQAAIREGIDAARTTLKITKEND